MKKVVKKIYNGVEYKLYEDDVKKVDELFAEAQNAEVLAIKGGVYLGYETSAENYFIEYLSESNIKTLSDLEFSRINFGLTRSELSKKSGVSVRTIEAYEQKLRNENTMPLDIYKKLYKALGKEFVEL